MKIYLLPFDEHKVKFSFDKEELVKTMQAEPGIPYQGILETEIDDDLAQKLTNPEPLESPYPRAIPQHYYYEKQEAFLSNPPEWHTKEGKRLYVFFDAKQRCYWSPSDNNLNSFYEKNPELYLSKAIRVELNKDAYVKLMGYFNCMSANF